MRTAEVRGMVGRKRREGSKRGAGRGHPGRALTGARGREGEGERGEWAEADGVKTAE